MFGSFSFGVILTALIMLVFSDIYVYSENIHVMNQTKIGLSFIIIGFGFSVFTISNYLMNKKKSWSFTYGRVDSVVSVKGFFGGDRYLINYSYTVDDRPHFNNAFNFTSKEVGLSKIKSTEGIINFSSISDIENEMIKIYYDPKKPWNSVLSRSGKINTLMTLMPSMFLCFYLGYIFIKGVFI